MLLSYTSEPPINCITLPRWEESTEDCFYRIGNKNVMCQCDKVNNAFTVSLRLIFFLTSIFSSSSCRNSPSAAIEDMAVELLALKMARAMYSRRC